MTVVDEVTKALQELEPELLQPLYVGSAAIDLADRIHAVRKLLAKQEARWIGTAEAQRLLGFSLEKAVMARVRWGTFRSRQLPDGHLEVLLDDVLREREVIEGLSAFGRENPRQEELERMFGDQPGTNPWEREPVNPDQ
jgi:hypothetical protein